MPRSTMLLALAASVTAEFESCARPSAIFAGFDQVSRRLPLPSCALLPGNFFLSSGGQGYGRSRGLAVTYTGGNVYVGGYA